MFRFKELVRAVHVAIQADKAKAAIVKTVASNGWLSPTDEQYVLALRSAVEDMKLTVYERNKVVEALVGLRDDIVKAARKNIKP